MNQYVKMTFIHELAQVLGPMNVSRGTIDDSTKGPQLRIQILRLQDPVNFLKVSFLTEELGKERQWLKL